MTMSAMKIQARNLSKGMYVKSIESKLDALFPLQGLLIENDRQLETLVNLCTKATIDLNRSTDTICKRWGQFKSDLTLAQTPSLPSVPALLIESTPRATIHREPTAHPQYKRPNYNQNTHKHGYKGRLLYRVLESKCVAMTNRQPVDMKILLQDIKNFILYSKINSDILFLESHLSHKTETLIGLGMRSIIHLCNYGHSFNKKEGFLQVLALTIIVYTATLEAMPIHISRHTFQQDFAENAILSNALATQYKTFEQKYKIPLFVKKNILLLCERVDGLGPRKISGSRLTQQSQLIKLAFTFEYLQCPEFNTIPMTASETIATLRAASNTILSATTLEKLIQTLPLFPTGSFVLTHDHIALVIHQHPVLKLTPHTLAIARACGTALDTAYRINNDTSSRNIQQCMTCKSADYEHLIREALEIKTPWYRRILSPKGRRSWF